jgi:undecaprenyl diphosphate synthase
VNNSIIKHLAIIPDGNRRWSKKNNVDLQQTYFYGCEKIFNICALLFDTIETIEEISLFFISLENLKTRPRNELDALFNAGFQFVDLFYSHSQYFEIELRWVGLENHDFEVDSSLYKDFINHIKLLEKTRNYHKKVNVLIGYDVCKDIERAIEKDKKFKYNNLEVSKPIDLIIRSGGFRRLSGFLPLICQYSEFEFIDKLFLELEESDITKSIENFYGLVRNFGN